MLAQAAQVLLSVPLATLTGLQWLTWLALANNVAAALHLVPWTVTVNWWLVAVAFVLFITPPGRMGIAVLVARMLLARRGAGNLPPRRVACTCGCGLAERLAEASGAENLAGAPWLVYYARALGAKVGKGVDLHSAAAGHRAC